MKVSRILLPLQLVIEAVTKLVNSTINRSPLPTPIPVRVQENNRFALMKSREAERRQQQGI